MTYKIVGITAIVACLMLAMGGHSVKAYERTCHYWSNGDAQCENGPYFSYHQQPTIKQVDCDYGWDCCKTNKAACDDTVTQSQIQTVSFQPADCFWSFPVKCYPS